MSEVEHPLLAGGGGAEEGGAGGVGVGEGGAGGGLKEGGSGTKVPSGGASKETAEFLARMKMCNPELFKDKEKGVSFGIISNKDYRVLVLDGPDRESKFICNVCDKECSSIHAVKTHITKVHVKGKTTEKDKAEKDDETEKGKGGKRRLSSPEVQDKEDKRRKGIKEFSLDDLEYWSKKETRNEETNKPAKVVEDPIEVEMDELSKNAEPRKIAASVFEEWKAEFEDEMKMKDVKLKSLEEAIANNRELLNVIKIEKESLEFDNNEKIEKIDEMEILAVKFRDAFMKMKTEIEELKATKEQSGNDEKVKEMKKEIKDMKKEVDEAKEKKNEALKKLKEETNKRAKLEADNTALRRQMRNMTTIAEEKSRRENIPSNNRNDSSDERRRSPIRRVENRMRSPIFPPRTPGRRVNIPERRGREQRESRSQERMRVRDFRNKRGGESRESRARKEGE